MDNTMKAMTAAVAMAVAALGVGCASIGAPEASTAPTHRWVAESDVSSAKYNFDNKACAESAMVDFRAPHATPEFALYERCMQSKGYELATY